MDIIREQCNLNNAGKMITPRLALITGLVLLVFLSFLALR